MPLAPGTLLGRYQVSAQIGAGGMGEVYKAIDTRLDRTVAVKVLAREIADVPDLRQRFEREAEDDRQDYEHSGLDGGGLLELAAIVIDTMVRQGA